MGTDAATHKTYACTRTHTHTQARLHKPAQAEKEEKKNVSAVRQAPQNLEEKKETCSTQVSLTVVPPLL